MNKDNYMFPKKSELKRLTISEMNVSVPDLKNIFEAKSVAVGKWLMKVIEDGLEKGTLKVNDILPSKPEFAYYLGVSIGTMQNAFRYIEDLGYVESKQCIGTLIRDYKKPAVTLRKLTSKRDMAANAIKRYIISDGLKVGKHMPSSRTLSVITGFTANTVRLAMENLAIQGILEHKYKNSSEYGWVLKSTDFDISDEVESSKATTLVDMVVKDLENYISSNLNVGDRLPSHMVLAQELKASIKTVHDALNILSANGILLAKRGRYGTTVVKMPNDKSVDLKPETSIFAPAADTAFYHYEKTQNYIKNLIVNNYQIGDKLPSISELSKELDLSENTVRKAFHNLAQEGYLVFSRGRYGGTFVIDMPEVESQSFKWLAIDPQYAKEYGKTTANN